MGKRDEVGTREAFWLVFVIATVFGAGLGALSIGVLLFEPFARTAAMVVGGLVGLVTALMPALLLSRKRLLIAVPVVYGVCGLIAALSGKFLGNHAPAPQLITVVTFLIACIAAGMALPDVRGGRGPHCPQCMYDTTGLTSPLCPECGHEWTAPLIVDPRNPYNRGTSGGSG